MEKGRTRGGRLRSRVFHDRVKAMSPYEKNERGRDCRRGPADVLCTDLFLPSSHKLRACKGCTTGKVRERVFNFYFTKTNRGGG